VHPLLGCVVLLLIAVAVFAALAVAISWIKKDTTHGSGQLGNALQNLEGLFVESKKNVIEAQQHEESEKDDSGED
jgi:hypothetical protein